MTIKLYDAAQRWRHQLEQVWASVHPMNTELEGIRALFHQCVEMTPEQLRAEHSKAGRHISLAFLDQFGELIALYRGLVDNGGDAVGKSGFIAVYMLRDFAGARSTDGEPVIIKRGDVAQCSAAEAQYLIHEGYARKATTEEIQTQAQRNRIAEQPIKVDQTNALDVAIRLYADFYDAALKMDEGKLADAARLIHVNCGWLDALTEHIWEPDNTKSISRTLEMLQRAFDSFDVATICDLVVYDLGDDLLHAIKELADADHADKAVARAQAGRQAASDAARRRRLGTQPNSGGDGA